MTLIEFAHEMEKKLEVNSHKTGWDQLTYARLLLRLSQEVSELRRAIKKAKGPGTARFVVEEAADVANFAMMIADNISNDDQWSVASRKGRDQ